MKIAKIIENIIVEKSSKVTKQMWDYKWSLDVPAGRKWQEHYDKRVDALLTVFSDPDKAEKHAERKWHSLPSAASNMTIQEGKLNERKLPKRFTVTSKFRVGGMVFNTGDYAKKNERMGKTMVLNMDNNEMLSIDYQDYIAAVKNRHIKEGKLTEAVAKLTIEAEMVTKALKKFGLKRHKGRYTPTGDASEESIQGLIKYLKGQGFKTKDQGRHNYTGCKNCSTLFMYKNGTTLTFVKSDKFNKTLINHIEFGKLTEGKLTEADKYSGQGMWKDFGKYKIQKAPRGFSKKAKAGAMIHFTGPKSGASGETWKKGFGKDIWLCMYGEGVKGNTLTSAQLDKKLESYGRVQIQEGKLTESKRKQIQFQANAQGSIKALLKNLKPKRDYDFGVGSHGMVLLDIDVKYYDKIISVLKNSYIKYKIVEAKLNEKGILNEIGIWLNDKEVKIISKLLKDSNVKLSSVERSILKKIIGEGKLTEASVPTKFDKAVFKVPPHKMTRDWVLKVAKKYNVEPKYAIAWVNKVGRLDLAEDKLNERSGLVAKTKAGSFTVHIVKNMKKLFLRIEKGGNVKTAILDKSWTDNQAEDVIEDIDEKGIDLLWRQLKNVDHPKYNSMDKNGKITVKKLSLSQQTLGRESVNEFTGKPMPMDTPNEFAYLDFKKFAYKNRSQYKKDMKKHIINGEADGSRMFMTASAWWFKWAYKNNKNFTHIKDKLKFGRALIIMMLKDNLVFDKKAWGKDNRITHIKEASSDFSIDTHKLADSFTPQELKKLKAGRKISAEELSGALELQRGWKDRHPSMRIGGGPYKKEMLKKLNEAKFSNFKQYIIKLAKEMGDRDLERDAKSNSKLKKHFDRDLHYKIFTDQEVLKYDGKKLHNMIKYDQRFNEGKLTEIKKGDYVEDYGDIGLVHKVKGKAAYVKFDGNPHILQPVEIAALKKKDKKHKGKDLYSENANPALVEPDGTIKGGPTKKKKVNELSKQRELEKVERWVRKSGMDYDDWDWDGKELTIWTRDGVEKYSKKDLKDERVFEGKLNEAKFYISSKKGLLKSSASNWKKPQVFNSYNDAEEYIGKEKAYWISDDKGNKLNKYGELEEGKLNESLSYDDAYNMLDIAAQYSSTQHQAASQMWSDAQDLYDYLKSDHIPRKYHKKFYKDIKRSFPSVKE